MGRIDKYSYHSEAGRADGTPGARERDPERDKRKCDECNNLSYSAVRRAGNFSNSVLCADCIMHLQEEKVQQQQEQVLSSINRHRERK